MLNTIKEYGFALKEVYLGNNIFLYNTYKSNQYSVDIVLLKSSDAYKKFKSEYDKEVASLKISVPKKEIKVDFFDSSDDFNSEAEKILDEFPVRTSDNAINYDKNIEKVKRLYKRCGFLKIHKNYAILNASKDKRSPQEIKIRTMDIKKDVFHQYKNDEKYELANKIKGAKADVFIEIKKRVNKLGNPCIDFILHVIKLHGEADISHKPTADILTNIIFEPYNPCIDDFFND